MIQRSRSRRLIRARRFRKQYTYNRWILEKKWKLPPSCLVRHVRSRKHHQHLQRKMPSKTRTGVCHHGENNTISTTKPALVVAIIDTCCAPDPSILHRDELHSDLLIRVSDFALRSKCPSPAPKSITCKTRSNVLGCSP
jgi:hypothetical protein